jgi:hypothetical protein
LLTKALPEHSLFGTLDGVKEKPRERLLCSEPAENQKEKMGKMDTSSVCDAYLPAEAAAEFCVVKRSNNSKCDCCVCEPLSELLVLAEESGASAEPDLVARIPLNFRRGANCLLQAP